MSFSEARKTVLAEVGGAHKRPAVEEIPLSEAAGRILAQDIAADRDTPALARSMRDGYAVRALDLPGELEIIGEVRAGQIFPGAVGPGQAVEIMTGAPVPQGADAVVMLEHTHRVEAHSVPGGLEHDVPTGLPHDAPAGLGRVAIGRSAEPQQNINPRGAEAVAHEVVLHTGKRLDYTDIAMLASFGKTRMRVFRKPSVALIATGDEIVEVEESPRDFEIRNSNIYSLAAQVARAGGMACLLPIARDTDEHTRSIVERGLDADLLLLSGGVSAGKYDVVERVLASLDAQFFFDRVLIQPGQPLVFGRARGKFFFGLPGNPASTMVTFEVFARAAVELLAGQQESCLRMPFARLTSDFHHKPGLTRFLPARLSADGAEVTPIAWHGSGDVPSLTRANAFLVAEPDCPEYPRGELIRVLLK